MQGGKVFKKILLATDGSPLSLIAQELTAFIAKKFNSTITVLHVVAHDFMYPQVQRFFVPTDEYAPVGTTGMPEGPVLQRVPKSSESSLSEEVAREITDWYHQKGKAAIADAIALFKEKSIPVDQKLVEHADPAETITREAEKGDYDLIVVGHSGEEEKEPHLGSVAKKVSRHGKSPVLIAREKSQISRILVPVDGSETAEKALQYAISLAKKTNAKMTLLHVQESTLFRLRPEVTKKIGTCILSKAAEKAEGLEIDQKLESGDPARVIIQTADKGDYDLIAIGSRGHGAIERFLLGSVSDHVTHYANCSVLIIR